MDAEVTRLINRLNALEAIVIGGRLEVPLNFPNDATRYLDGSRQFTIPPGAGNGSVVTVSVVSANGVSGSVANPTTTPAITLTLGAITPSSVAASGNVTGANLGNITPINLDGNGSHVLLGNGSFGAAPSSGALSLISHTIPTSGSSVTVAIPAGTYKHIEVYAKARSDANAASTFFFLTFNADGGGNYDNHRNTWAASGASYSDDNGDTHILMGFAAPGNATANWMGQGRAFIYDYNDTTAFKQVETFGGTGFSAGTFNAEHDICQWRSTAAIGNLTVALQSGNFTSSGNIISVYGRS